MTPASVRGRFATFGRRASPPTASDSHLLHKRLEHARLGKMLRRMHVSLDVYLQRLHPDPLREQLDACAACPHQFLCDQALACKRPADMDLSFCPNRDSIRSATRAA